MRAQMTAAIVFGLLLAGTARASEHPEHPKSNAKPAEAASAGALEGKSFTGQLGKAGETAGDKDQLFFKKGTFLSTACVPFGFHEAPYTVAEKDGVVTFTASPSNAKGETMSWTGTVRDGVLEGTAVHKTASGETRYWFKGKLGPSDKAPGSKEPPKKAEHPEHPK